jgi:hypothetical protein
VAGGLEGAVAGAIVLEGVAGAVCGEAVELGDEAVRRPEAVDGPRSVGELDRGVDLRSREIVLVEEREKTELELVAGDRLADAAASQERSDRGRPGTIRGARDEGAEGRRAREPPDLRLGSGAFKPGRAEDRGEVEEGACRCGDGTPCRAVCSSGASRAWWICNRGRGRRALGTVISVRSRSVRRMPQRAAAEWWLRTAWSATSVAAMYAARGERTRWPTAYTPRWSAWRRRFSRR